MTHDPAAAIDKLRSAIERNPQRIGYATIRAQDAALILERIDELEAERKEKPDDTLSSTGFFSGIPVSS